MLSEKIIRESQPIALDSPVIAGKPPPNFPKNHPKKHENKGFFNNFLHPKPLCGKELRSFRKTG
jgi:hypothetical protein